MNDHECPHPTCFRRVPYHMFACGPHWFMLSKTLRDRIWDTWTGGDRAEHAVACGEAIRFYRIRAGGVSSASRPAPTPSPQGQPVQPPAGGLRPSSAGGDPTWI